MNTAFLSHFDANFDVLHFSLYKFSMYIIRYVHFLMLQLLV
jgi:hypothetical protein